MLIFVFQKKHAHVLIDKPDGSFSKVDVDKVDLQKYPGLADVPWYKANMEAGDCLFIPYRYERGNSDNYDDNNSNNNRNNSNNRNNNSNNNNNRNNSNISNNKNNNNN